MRRLTRENAKPNRLALILTAFGVRSNTSAICSGREPRLSISRRSCASSGVQCLMSGYLSRAIPWLSRQSIKDTLIARLFRRRPRAPWIVLGDGRPATFGGTEFGNPVRPGRALCQTAPSTSHGKRTTSSTGSPMSLGAPGRPAFTCPFLSPCSVMASDHRRTIVRRSHRSRARLLPSSP